MTCTHVIDLIDAGPFADCPSADLDAAWEHARQCATCGPALQAAIALTTNLRAMALPAPPPYLAAGVLARIAPVDQAGSAHAPTVQETRAPFSTRDWSAWPTALGGLAAGLATVLSMAPGGVPIDIASPRVGGLTVGLVAMPSTTTGALVLAAGLALYVAGLFAPVRGSKSAITDQP